MRLLLLTIIITGNLFAQNQLNFKQIDQLDRSSIILLAKKEITQYLDLINDTSFDYSLIDTIRILKNKEKYIVRFEQTIKYVPMNSAYYYGFDVDLINNYIYKLPGSNNGSTSTPSSFFHPSNEDQKKIQFVRIALSLVKYKEPMMILEKETYYEVNYISGGEKVAKIDGERFDWWDVIILPDPDTELIETKIM